MQSTPRSDVNRTPPQTLLTNAFFVDIWQLSQSKLISSFTDKRDNDLSKVTQNEIAFSLWQQKSCVKWALSAELLTIMVIAVFFNWNTFYIQFQMITEDIDENIGPRGWQSCAKWGSLGQIGGIWANVVLMED